MSESSWTDPDVIVQLVASATAVVAFGAVVVQTVLTRKALDEASSSRRVAEEALNVARAEQSYSALLSVEAIKARIASNAPSADFTVDHIEDAAFLPSVLSSGHPQAAPDGQVFTTLAGQQIVMIRAKVTLRNTGDRAARFVLHGAIRRPVTGDPDDNGVPHMVGTRAGPRDVLLAAGESTTGYWEVNRTVDEWIAIYDARHGGRPDEGAELVAYFDDGHDTGASCWYTLVLDGAALQPQSPALRESWVYAGLYENSLTYDGVGSGVKPVNVRYWLSRQRNMPLPELAPDTLAPPPSAES